jgi:nucleoside-diphosphate-sugar epimerase
MHRQIFLTGATGALGPALAAELVRTEAAGKIVVLMRAASASEARERFGRWVEEVRSLLPEELREAGAERLEPVAGDLCAEGLGVEEWVRRKTDVVIHAAADTNFAAPPARQWDVNVEGTRRMVEWSAGCPGLRRFLLVSSVYVSGSRTGRIDETATEERPEFVTHYQRTKWESERVTLRSGLPAGIARISLVLGSHADGRAHRTGAVHSLIKWFARGLLPVVPGLPEARGDVIATETAAECLARAVAADWKGIGSEGGGTRVPIWHIASGERAPRMMELIDFVYQHFAQRPAWRRRNIPRPQMVEQAQFAGYIEAMESGGHGSLAGALRSVNRFLPDLLFPKTYQTRRAEALCGGALPQYDWRETMERVIRFCCPADK